MTKQKSSGPTKKQSLVELEQQIGELTEALMRERADAANVRRRAEEEKAALATFYKALVVREIMPVLDNFERAIKHTPEDLVNHDYAKGVQGVVKQFEDVMAKLGVSKIETVGKSFDPNLHEAVSVEGEGSKEVVSEELQPGYILGDEVLRHAMVKVKLAK